MVITIRKVLVAFVLLILLVYALITGFLRLIDDGMASGYAFLEIDDVMVSKDKEIDMEIQNVLGNNTYNFEKPLIIQDPFDKTPLTALIVFNTENDVAIRVTIVGDTETDTFKHEFPKGMEHRIPVIGLYPDRKNTVVIEQIVDGKVTKNNELNIETEPLPEKLQNMVKVTNNKEEAVEGITVVSGGPFNTPYAFDSSGQIRWYMKTETDNHGYFPTSNGRFMIMSSDSMLSTQKRKYSTKIFDMDFLGRLHKLYFIPNGAHHEIIEKERDGNLLVLSNSLENHVEDLVVELDRDTGEVVRELKLSNVIKDTYNEAYDWAHINSISYNNEDDSVILSVRNVSAAVKINWSTQELMWILSDPRIWEGSNYEEYVLMPTGPTVWHYEQHTVYEHIEDLDNNSETLDIMMFDNRVIRNHLINENIEEDSDRSSVTQYSIDEVNKTVTQVKRFPNSLAYITSNYQLFYNKDRLIANHASLKSGDKFWGEIYEYKYSTGEMVRSYKTRYSYYRAFRQDFDFQSTNKPLN